MKQIIRGQSNDFYCTVTEKKTLSSPYWLLRFVSDSTHIERAFVKANTSTHTERYDLFSIIEGTDISADASLTKGIWTYRIYEQSSASNTNYLLATTECEVGQVLVKDATENIQQSFPSYTIESSYSSQ